MQFLLETRMRTLALSPSAIKCRRYSTRGALFHATSGSGAPCIRGASAPASAQGETQHEFDIFSSPQIASRALKCRAMTRVAMLFKL